MAQRTTDTVDRPRATPADGDGPPSPRIAHLVGVAGSGMSALAEVLSGWGWRVSGSDLCPDALDQPPFVLWTSAPEPARAGVVSRQPPEDRPHRATSGAVVRVYRGHQAEHLPADAELVVASDAVPRDNVELRAAEARGLPGVSYFEMVGRLMQGASGLAVAGTHGKSTTTAMLAAILTAAGRDPTVFCGAAPPGRASGGRAGRADLVLAEACEYRQHFLHLSPRRALLLGVEPDHFDCFPSEQSLHEAFERFVDRLPRDGLLVVSGGCPVAPRIARRAACPVESFLVEDEPNRCTAPADVARGAGRTGPLASEPGTPPRAEPADRLAVGADWIARNVQCVDGRYRFDLCYRGSWLGCVELRVPGRHNVANALAAAALAWHEGVAPAAIVAALEGFAGLRRRLEHVGRFGGVELFDDYAHHPTEVAAALAALHSWRPGRRLWCVFQPHQASRTARLLDALARSLHNADSVFVAEVYRAREGPPKPGEATAADLAARIRDFGGDARTQHGTEAILAALGRELRPGDVLVTIGAGDIRKVCDGVARRFREDRAAG